MKFKSTKLELGSRFYIFTSEEEYRIVSLVKIDNKNSGQFMDEETFEIQTISKKDLNDNYTLLSDSKLWIICNFRPKNEFKDSQEYKDTSMWLINNDIKDFLNNEYASYPFEVNARLRIVVYKFMRETVFNKLINYIIKLNAPKFLYNDNDVKCIWDIYFRYLNENLIILSRDDLPESLDMDEVINGKAKIPDSVIDTAEDLLNVPILSYDPYVFDDSINMNNINMKYFFIFVNDKYYIILYVIDTKKEAITIRENLNENMDIVNFMLK